MSVQRLLRTERLAGGSWGDDYAAMRQLALAECGEAAALLAECATEPETALVKWFVVGAETLPQPFPAPTDPAAAPLRALLEQHRETLGRWAHAAAVSDQPARAVAGRLLADTLRRAGPETLFVVDGCPILAAMGDASLVTVERRQSEVLRRRSVSFTLFLTPDKRWSLAVLAVAILGMLTAAVLGAFGVLPTRVMTPGAAALPAPTIDAQSVMALVQARDQEGVLRARLDELIAVMAERRQACVAKSPQQRPLPGNTLQLPPGMTQAPNLNFLTGCWINKSGVSIDMDGAPPITKEYCFDQHGKGTHQIHFVGRSGECNGGVEARVEGDGSVSIVELEAAACTGSDLGVTSITPVIVRCNREADGTTKCSGHRMSDQKPFNVKIVRK